MRGIVDILNAEQDGNTDEDLLVYALTLVNKASALCLIVPSLYTIFIYKNFNSFLRSIQ